MPGILTFQHTNRGGFQLFLHSRTKNNIAKLKPKSYRPLEKGKPCDIKIHVNILTGVFGFETLYLPNDWNWGIRVALHEKKLTWKQRWLLLRFRRGENDET